MGTDILTAFYAEEKARTKECLDDVVKLLSHDTSITRRQLAEVLRQRAAMIESEIHADTFLFGGRSRNVVEGFDNVRLLRCHHLSVLARSWRLSQRCNLNPRPLMKDF